eukprot:2464676-Prymnesium_polylepis.1
MPGRGRTTPPSAQPPTHVIMPAHCRSRLTHRGARREPARCVHGACKCANFAACLRHCSSSTQASGQDGQARADGALAGQAD